MKSKYIMSESQVESLATEYASASVETARVGMTYLRVLVAACQAIIGTSKRGRHAAAAQAEVLDGVASKYYAAVLRGVTTADIVPDTTLPKPEQTRRSLERNRRSTFARSAKSTLAAYIGTGGDLRGLDVETLTRDPLLKLVRAARGTSDNAHRMERARNLILRVVAKEAKTDATAARADLEHTIEALQFALDGLSPNGNKVPVEVSRETVEPTLRAVPEMKGRLMHSRMRRPATVSHGRAA